MGNKVPFGSKTVFLRQEVKYYMVYIAYYTELNLQICNYTQIRRICREKSKYALGESFYGRFCPRSRGPASATLHVMDIDGKSSFAFKMWYRPLLSIVLTKFSLAQLLSHGAGPQKGE